MKKTAQSLLILAIIFASSSSKDELDPDHQNENTEFEVDVSTIIGITGGQVVTDEFVLDIPPGAFSSDHTIVLSSATDQSTFGDDLVSRLYKIEGLPGSYNKQLRVKIKYS
ncbi:MAG: hypothetical protein GVY20_06620 [Bacteroidetes bacterium]|jgi:hypothetical protein|nr:hypothetical protein [Bacteroidota bacterium]